MSGSPIIHNDSLLCGSADGKLHCLEYRSGRLRWVFQAGGAITGTLATSNDTVFFGSADHLLYALVI
jgi:outer membrane protein assembly factor BamB